MTGPAHLPEREVARRADALPGVRPLRIHPLLVPMWAAEVTATVREAHPYEVFDRFLARAVAEAGLRSTPELAEFLGVEPALVARALDFLIGLGHLERDGDRVTLTELGRRSVADGRRYVLAPHRRMVLRFDGLDGAPVPYGHVTRSIWLGDPELTLADGTRFRVMPGAGALPDDAVAALLSRRDVGDFSGPMVPVAAETTVVRPVWLPVYLVECVEEPLVFGRAVDGPDPYLGALLAPWVSDVVKGV
ncbi:hypothetical protein [Actinoplanes sp. NBRC 101535]|uniref:hypothetical protein n=1 Tax=Actinoplanes sp. NBRC 101535 TaxID=3032196 RepID=UPI0024A4953C|nr:hypothetical protein [Actinoplanes sp. NBRC 101535]GLX99941.1 hypothetical protein Acsp01_03210 [Actinoplanes sp. NBRC 101535]